MAVAEAAKIVFQTALAGTLESKGFRRVSDTNYVIEGDGIEWRVIFGPEYKDEPGTFREETGIFIPEVDRLCLALESQSAPLSLPMARTKYRAHFSFECSSIIDPKKPYNEREHDPCYIPEQIGSDRRGRWATKGKDLEALGQRIDHYWQRDTWPWLRDRMTLGTACGPLPSMEWVPGDRRGTWFELLQWWACGHRDLVISKFSDMERDAAQDDHQIFQILKEKKQVGRSLFLGRFIPFLSDVKEQKIRDLRQLYIQKNEHMQEIIDLLNVRQNVEEKMRDWR